MTDGWYEPAIPNPARGTMPTFTGPVEIGVLHTTESTRFVPAPDSYFGHKSYPHFTVVNDRGVFKCYQHISIRKAAKALANKSGGVETGREGCIQIEVVGAATKPFTVDLVLVDGLSKLMRWIESETEIPRSCGVSFARYPDSYGERAEQRLSPGAWVKYQGWLGHQHVPENTHGDPGAIDITKLLGPATGALRTEPSASTWSLEDDDMAFTFNDGSKTYLREGGDTIHVPTQADLDTLTKAGVKNVGKLSVEMTARLVEAARQ